MGLTANLATEGAAPSAAKSALRSSIAAGKGIQNPTVVWPASSGDTAGYPSSTYSSAATLVHAPGGGVDQQGAPGSAVSSRPVARSDLGVFSSEGCRVQRHLTWQHPSPHRLSHLDLPATEQPGQGDPGPELGRDQVQVPQSKSFSAAGKAASVSRYATNPIPLLSSSGGGAMALVSEPMHNLHHNAASGVTAPSTISSGEFGSVSGSGSRGSSRLFAHQASKSSASWVASRCSEDDTINCRSQQQHKKGAMCTLFRLSIYS